MSGSELSEAPASLRTTGPELVIQHSGQVFSLTQETVTLGSQDDNTIVLADPEVSDQHAVISWDEEAR